MDEENDPAQQHGRYCPVRILLPAIGDSAEQHLGALLFQYGGSVVTDDGKNTNFNNEAGRKAAEFVLNSLYEWEITDPNITQRYDYWLTGQASSFYSGTWVVGSSLQQNLNFRTDVMPVLGDKRAVMYEYSGLVLPYGRSDEVKEAVGKIYKYIVEHAGEFGVASSQIPVTMEGLAYQGYVESSVKEHFRASEENGQHAFWDVSHPKGAEFSSTAQAPVQSPVSWTRSGTSPRALTKDSTTWTSICRPSCAGSRPRRICRNSLAGRTSLCREGKEATVPPSPAEVRGAQ